MGTLAIVAVIMLAVVNQMFNNWWAGRSPFDNGKKREEEAGSLRIGGLHAVAQCGCDMVDGQVVVLCPEHRARAGGNRTGRPGQDAAWWKTEADLRDRLNRLRTEIEAQDPESLGYEHRMRPLLKRLRDLDADMADFKAQEGH